METIERTDLQPTYRVCRFHNRPTVFAITGRGTAYVACDTAGCQQDAETDHRMVVGAGYLPTVRYAVTDPER